MKLTKKKLKNLLLDQSKSISVSSDFAEDALDYYDKFFIKDNFQAPKQKKIEIIARGKISNTTFISLIQRDKPFIINSIILLLTKYGIKPRALLHPVLLKSDYPDLHHDLSIVYISLDRQLSIKENHSLKKELLHVCELNKKVVDNFKNMRVKVISLIETIGSKKSLTSVQNDSVASLHWFLDDNFIFQGWTKFIIKNNKISERPSKQNRLGICENLKEEIWLDLDNIVKSYNNKSFKQDAGIMLEKSAYSSKVHRNALIDIIIYLDKDSGELDVFLGLRTSKANFTSIANLPFLADKIKKLSVALNFETKGSADENFFRNNLNEFSWEGLIRQDHEELVETFNRIMVLSVFPSPRIFFFKHSFLPRLQSLIILPKDYYSVETREKITNFLEKELSLKSYNSKAVLSGDAFARLVIDFEIITPQKDYNAKLEYLEKTILLLAKSWEEEYRGYISERNLDAEDFPKKYRVEHSPRNAISDGILIKAARSRGVALALDLTNKDGFVVIKMAIKSEATPALTDTLPIFERCQIAIRDESYYRIQTTKQTVYLIYFTLNPSGLSLNDYELLKENGSSLLDTISFVWNNKQDNDYFNALSWKAGLSSNQIELLRTLAAWLKQTKTVIDASGIALVLAKYPAIANEVISLFYGLYSHAEAKKTPLQIETLITWHDAQLEAVLHNIKSRYEDSMIRNLFMAVKGSVRTNYFFKKVSDPLVIKFQTEAIGFVEEPKPYREIFVYSRDFEGVHLRFGPIARGGIRWSDRIDDYRTEILGLAKAQKVKNAVIVPTGAKGGFVVKNAALAGVDAYKIFIRSLLSVTDNIVGKKNISSPSFKDFDVFDPYLVVAADKGTAKFSDVANSIAVENKFWLKDAFASGGKNGYDHKVLGITARGAWESLKRHFYEMNIDPLKDEISVVAIGDMGGDVFGNGLLESKSIKLIAAFNHAHIFIDPNPDPKESYAVRKELFKSNNSGWNHYPHDKLSKGGKVYSRDQKTLFISKQIQDSLGFVVGQLPPDEVITHLLKLKVDLLYFAGIGTFVKASDETNFEASDTFNDYVRINGKDINAKVVVEGANLGMTQMARIEFAEKNGRINTDSLDNLSGVTSSDYEVNIKILLNQLVEKDKLTFAKRNKLLNEVESEVVEQVLSSNYNTALAISIIERKGASVSDMLRNIMRRLEQAGKLNRALEYLPGDQDLDVRISQQKGLYRPELAILLSYVKIDVKEKILANKASIPAAVFGRYLIEYFPKKIQKLYESEIIQHRLAFEIFVNLMTNSAINRLGMSFFYNLNKWTGASDHIIIIAYAIARDQLNVKQLWDKLKDREKEIGANLYYQQLEIISQIIIDFTITLCLALNDSNLSKTYNFLIDNQKKTISLFLKVTKPPATKKKLIDFLSIKKDRIAKLKISDERKAEVLNLENIRLANLVYIESNQLKLDYTKFTEVYLHLGVAYSLEKIRILLSEAKTGELWTDRSCELNYIELSLLHKSITHKLIKAKLYDIPDSQLKDRFMSVVDDINFIATINTNILSVAVQLLQMIEKSL